jgi:hypothetical protein
MVVLMEEMVTGATALFVRPVHVSQRLKLFLLTKSSCQRERVTTLWQVAIVSGGVGSGCLNGLLSTQIPQRLQLNQKLNFTMDQEQLKLVRLLLNENLMRSQANSRDCLCDDDKSFDQLVALSPLSAHCLLLLNLREMRDCIDNLIICRRVQNSQHPYRKIAVFHAHFISHRATAVDLKW